MKQRIRGAIDVKLTPQTAPDAPVGRMILEKTFHGALAATSIGEMLAIQGGLAGSAGYVAMERVTGSLEGRDGSFALQHRGVMDRGVASLTITVLPDSGTGALVGLPGSVGIEIVESKHFYIRLYARGKLTPRQAAVVSKV
jgi:hypothetical protein